MISIDATTNSTADADPVSPGRAALLRECSKLIARGAGPIVIAGESGIGKTWFRKRLEAADRAIRWIEIDARPGGELDDFLHALARGAGLRPARDRISARTALDDFLVEESAGGRRWGLAIDEAHHLSDDLLEEIRLLANRIGRPNGFAGILLVGESSLTRRLSERRFAGLTNRLSASVHPRPIDADEAKTLLERRFPLKTWENSLVETLHRDAWGNPGRILILAEKAASENSPQSSPPASSGVDEPGKVEERNAAPVLGATRPPIRVEEGLIEVGWDAESEDDFSPEAVPSKPAVPEEQVEQGLRASEKTIHDIVEAIDDPYAAIQAWNEWLRNRREEEESSLATGSKAVETFARQRPEDAERAETDEAGAEESLESRVWSDRAHDFAPYGQLFGRARSLSDRESGE